MNWLVYWFMFPACIVIAGTATFSGISGAALMTPLFLIGFPLMRVPRLGTVEAIGAALFLETSGFGAGVYYYVRMRLVDLATARMLIVVTAPLAIIGAIVAQHAPATALRLGYGVAMLGVAWLLFRADKKMPGRRATAPCPCLICDSECSESDCPDGEGRELHASNGSTYRWCPMHLGSQRALSGAGAFLAGLISTGVGEATLPTLVRRSRLPVAVAAATSTLVVAATVFAGAATHFIQLAMRGGLDAIPWNLIVWGVPGSIIGAALGTHLHGRVSERATSLFFSALFFVIGVTFLVAFTMFAGRFA